MWWYHLMKMIRKVLCLNTVIGLSLRRYHTENSQKNVTKAVETKAFSHPTIRRWRGLFWSENKGKKMATPLGLLEIYSNKENMSAVKKIVKAEQHICQQEISSDLALSLGTVHSILHGNLQNEKACCKVDTAHTIIRSETMPIWHCHMPSTFLWAKQPRNIWLMWS